MTRGSNGLPVVQNLNDRLKCPAHPTKRRWVDGDLTREEAERRTRSLNKRGVKIEAYLCDSCGNYHLTKSTGGQNVILPDGQYTVGEFQSRVPDERVLPTPEDPEPPIVPGDFDTRLRFARRYLEQNPEPTSEEMCEALGGCTRDSLRKVMQALGYRNTRGRSARWVKIATSDGRTKDDVSRETSESDDIHVPVIDRATGKPVELDPSQAFDAGPAPHWEAKPQAGAPLWIDLDLTRIQHLAVGDLVNAYAAAGFNVRIQIGDDQ